MRELDRTSSNTEPETGQIAISVHSVLPMKILRTKRGVEIQVDDDLFDMLNAYTWRTRVNQWGHSYARTDSLGKTILLHRLIMNATKGQIVDHIDGNSLNNQMANLRLCTTQQNAWNSKPKSKSLSQYKGVVRGRWGKRWSANIRTSEGRKFLGTFDTEREAALAYNKAAKEFHGEYVRLNELTDE
jgi:hypothetical protein